MNARSTGRLDGKVAVVTGGASGIGAATVRRFVEEGARVVIADLQGDLAAALAAEVGDETLAITADVAEEDDVAAAVDAAMSSFGRLDIMFNNAGIIGAVGPIGDTAVESWDATVAVLLRSVFLGMKHASRVMVPQRSGVIISTSSTAGVLGGLGPHAYTACKHAVVGLTRSVSSELSQYGIRVNAIAPGNTVTPLIAAAITGDYTDIASAERHVAASSPLGFAAEGVDIANAALYLASDEARNVTGHLLVVDAGQTTNGGSMRFHSVQPAVVREAGRRDS